MIISYSALVSKSTRETIQKLHKKQMRYEVQFRIEQTFALYLIRVRVPAHFLDPEFINLWFCAPYFKETQIHPEIIQQCGQANFNSTKLAHTLFPIPPLAEQRCIESKVDALETQLATARTTTTALLEAAVAKLTNKSA